MSDRDILLVDHMLTYAEKAQSVVSGLPREIYDDQEVYQYAVAYLVQTIGEAAYHVSMDLKARHPQIEWVKIANTRHRIVHGYTDIDFTLLWTIVLEHLPVLERQLRALQQMEGIAEA